MSDSSEKNTETPKYHIIQNNGQRIYSSPLSKRFPRPGRGTEVFVGNLPRNFFENELIPMFERIGPIYKLRLMMNFDDYTRGFAFIRYCFPEDANKAILEFNNYAIRHGALITVHLSLDNCRLYFGNIPSMKTAEEIKQELGKFLEGISDVIIYKEPLNPQLNRGYAFVEFESHAEAAIARRTMLDSYIRLWGRDDKVFVDWAEPEPVIKPQVLQQVSILYFKNLPIGFSTSQLKFSLLQILDYYNITRVYKKDNYAFVHFRHHEDAREALAKLRSDTLMIKNQVVEVEWARPKSYSKKYRLNEVPDNLCMSVPPRSRKLIQYRKGINSPNIYDKSTSSPSSYSENDDATDHYPTDIGDLLASKFNSTLNIMD